MEPSHVRITELYSLIRTSVGLFHEAVKDFFVEESHFLCGPYIREPSLVRSPLVQAKYSHKPQLSSYALLYKSL
jgi:hypothetical protein